MTIKKVENADLVTLSVEGRLDTTTAPELEATLAKLENFKKVCFDFTKLAYISSAGLRILLATHKRLTSKNGKMTIKGINDTIKEIFEMTGLLDLFTIEA